LVEARLSGLAQRLRHKIEAEGPIGLDDFMRAALLDSEFGYYRHADPIGRGGDFTTAPEISQMFGELVALWCADRWLAMGKPDPVLLVELGPGRGVLAADMLRTAASIPGFRKAIRLHLIEVNPRLAAAQRSRLGEAEPCWHECFATVPAGPLLLVANEFFDALPIRQFERTEAGWSERRIAFDAASGEFRFVCSPLREPPPGAPADCPTGRVFEQSAAAAELVGAIARRVMAGGAGLLIDYGGEGGVGDSLQAVRRHRAASPLAAPGQSDLSAHVDFAALGRAARAEGAAVFGPAPQGVFLAALGLEKRLQTLSARASPEVLRELLLGAYRLTDRRQMGELFKALAISSPELGSPAGFS
jgi:NADH dehydrogenase [ubiquinone] 1 alpha subcomplex assembly factor 7